MQASIPKTAAGLCNGANSPHFLIFSIASSSIIADSLKISPPWTTLCPIAFISSKLSITWYSGFVNCFKVKSIASAWLYAGFWISTFLPFALCVINASSSPIP